MIGAPPFALDGSRSPTSAEDGDGRRLEDFLTVGEAVKALAAGQLIECDAGSYTDALRIELWRWASRAMARGDFKAADRAMTEIRRLDAIFGVPPAG